MSRSRSLLALLLCAALLGSCTVAHQQSSSAQSPATLHVFTDLSLDSHTLRAAFRRLHPDVELTITQLPAITADPRSAERQEAAIQEIRTQVMAGKGPDVFLLSAWPLFDVERLFPDLQKTMRTGAFLDLGPLLEQRSDWSPEDFPAPLFGAGTVDGALYLHPLSYTPGTFLLTEETAASLPEDAPIFDLSRCAEWLPWAESQGKQLNADFLLSDKDSYWTMMEAPMLDYEQGRALLDNPLLWQLEELSLAQALQPKVDFAFRSGQALGCINGLFDQVIAAKQLALDGIGTRFRAMRSETGGVNAMVDTVAAVRRGAAYPDAALDFICMLLTPQFQGGGFFGNEGEPGSLWVTPLDSGALPVRTASLEDWLAAAPLINGETSDCSLAGPAADSLRACVDQITTARLPDICFSDVFLAVGQAESEGRSLADVFAELDARWDIYVTE